MNVKAIMCDIDGTLLSSDGVVTPKTVEMIKKAREQRILFGLSTGRDVNSIQTLLTTKFHIHLYQLYNNFSFQQSLFAHFQ